MSDPLKGGFGSFTGTTPFKPPGATGNTTQPTISFGNANQTAPSATNASNTGTGSTPSLFGGGGANLFGGTARMENEEPYLTNDC